MGVSRLIGSSTIFKTLHIFPSGIASLDRRFATDLMLRYGMVTLRSTRGNNTRKIMP